MGKGMDLTGLKKRLFFWAVDLAQSYEEGQKPTLKTKIADKLIYSGGEKPRRECPRYCYWRECLPRTIGACIFCGGNSIREGYGQTESSPVIAVNRRRRDV